MKVENGKIVEASEKELFDYYLTRGLDEILSFSDYIKQMEKAGVKIYEYWSTTVRR